MFEKKPNTERERKSVQDVDLIAKTNDILNSQETNNDSGRDKENETDINTGRKRTNSVLDKAKLFNANNTNPSTSLIKEVSSLPLQNYKKVVDESTGKLKWVEGGSFGHEEGSMTSRRANNKPEMEVERNDIMESEDKYVK